MDLPTRLDLYALGRDYIVQRGKNVDPDVVDTEGSDANLFVGSVSVIGEAILRQLAYSSARMTLDGSEGEDLDRWAYDRYRLLRKGASPAVGSVRFFRATTAAGAGSVPIGTKLTTRTGAEYITTTVASFAAGDTSSTADVRASQAGKATQVGANMIFRVSQPQLLWDQTLQVNNDLATAGGEDVEDDDTFKDRIRNFWNAARRGVIGAIEFGAKLVPGVVSAQAIEVTNGEGMPARVVVLYIADSSGVASAALANLVQVQLLDYRAAGIAVLVNTSIPTFARVVLQLAFVAGTNTVLLSQLVQAAVVGFINSLPTNATLAVGDLYAVLKRFSQDGLVVNQNSIASPAGDLVPAVGQTFRARPQDVTLVAPPPTQLSQ